MIGPLAPGGKFLTVADFAASPSAPAVTLVAQDGVAAIPRSTSGIINMGGNTRGKVLTVPVTSGETFYFAQWDDSGGTPFSDEAVWVTRAVAVTAPDISGAGPGSVDSLTHTIKRNDTLPNLRRLLLDGSGEPMDLSAATIVKFTMRLASDMVMSGTAKVHATANIIDAVNGVVEYEWATGDTDTTTDGGSAYAGEFEVTFNDGTIQTFPAAAGRYIQITIPRDLDPGVNP